MYENPRVARPTPLSAPRCRRPCCYHTKTVIKKSVDLDQLQLCINSGMCYWKIIGHLIQYYTLVEMFIHTVFLCGIAIWGAGYKPVLIAYKYFKICRLGGGNVFDHAIPFFLKPILSEYINTFGNLTVRSRKVYVSTHTHHNIPSSFSMFFKKALSVLSVHSRTIELQNSFK